MLFLFLKAHYFLKTKKKMEPKEKKAFEPSGLVPRSIVRTFERFRQQLLPGSETAAIREYRISRYQVLVSARCLFTLLIIPIATNWLVSSWLLSPLVEHFWNTQQNEIFVNSYQEERAFAELESFSEKLFFESLLNTTNTINVANPLTSSASPYLAPNTDPIGTPRESIDFVDKEARFDSLANYYNPLMIPFAYEIKLGVSKASPVGIVNKTNFGRGFALANQTRKSIAPTEVKDINEIQAFTPNRYSLSSSAKPLGNISVALQGQDVNVQPVTDSSINKVNGAVKGKPFMFFNTQLLTPKESKPISSASQLPYDPFSLSLLASPWDTSNVKNKEGLSLQYCANISSFGREADVKEGVTKRFFAYPLALQGKQDYNQELNELNIFTESASNPLSAWSLAKPATVLSYSSAMTYDNSLKVKEKVQNKILELAIYYNQQTIISITNIIGDIVSLVTLGCLFIWMKPEITILKSFLIEAIYSLSDTTKSFLLILLTDLLVGFHSPRGWETALELLLKHFGLPENQDFVFLFVATFPVLLDTVFKYWIFRHLNKISPSTVATYHSMIE